MIKLYGFGKGFGLTDASPFVLKLHTWLRMNQLEYETINRVSNVQKAPKGKLPFIDDNGTIVADSSVITGYLEKHYQLNSDSWLTAEQKAVSFLISRALEEHLYWCLIYSRWIDEDGWVLVEKEFFGKLPFPLRTVLPLIVRRSTKIGAHKQGIARHSKEEVLQMTGKTAAELSVFLGTKPFMMGEQVSNLDASAFGMLAQFILAELDSGYNQAVRSWPNLVAYCERMQSAYFNS